MNFGTPVPLLLGIFSICGAVALFFLSRFKPGYERDYDKIYALLFLLSGIFLLVNLTMDLLASFQQLIMVGMLTTLTIQNIQARTPLSDRYRQQPGSSGPPGRDGYPPPRPNRPSYRGSTRTSMQAELDRRDIPPDPRYSRPMLSGYEDQDRPRRSYDQDAYYDRGAYPDKGYSDKGSYSDQGDYSDKGTYSDKPTYRDDAYSDKGSYSEPDRYSGKDSYSSKDTYSSSSKDSFSERDSYREKPYDGRLGEDDSLEGPSRSDQPSSYYGDNPRPDIRLRRRRPSRPRRDF